MTTATVDKPLSRPPIPHSCPDIGEAEREAVVACLRSLHVKGGLRVEDLERRVAADLGFVGGVATVSGAHAVHLALRSAFHAAPVSVGLPSYVCRSLYDAVCLAGCKPVLVDIDPDHLSTSIDHARGLELSAVIVPHMFGIRAPIEAFLAGDWLVIEDCAQRIAPFEIGRAEPRGHLRILSFEATKLLTCGEGGLLLADDQCLLNRARDLRDGSYDFPEPALRLPMTDLSAAIALVQWERLPSFLGRRRELADFYLDTIGRAHPHELLPAMRRENTHPFRFVLRVDDPDAFLRFGEQRGVTFRRPVAPAPLHRLFQCEGAFPVTDRMFDQLVSIPLYPRLSDDDAKLVADVVTQYLEGLG